MRDGAARKAPIPQEDAEAIDIGIRLLMDIVGEDDVGKPLTLEAWDVDESLFRVTMASMKRKWGEIPEPKTGDDPLDGVAYRFWKFPDKELWAIWDWSEEPAELDL